MTDSTTHVPDSVLEDLKDVSNATVLYLLMMRGIGRKYGHGPIWMEGVHCLAPGRRMVGRAVTLRYLPTRPDLQDRVARSSSADGMNETPRWHAVERCGEDDVLVSDAMGRSDVSTGGEIVYARLRERGAVGIVTDGAIRDAAAVVDFGLPVYAGGRTPTVGETKMMPFEVNVPVQCGHVLVWPGDVILGDDDGIVVLPAVTAEEVTREAVRHENIERSIMDFVTTTDESPSRFYPFNDDTIAYYERWKRRSSVEGQESTDGDTGEGSDTKADS